MQQPRFGRENVLFPLSYGPLHCRAAANSWGSGFFMTTRAVISLFLHAKEAAEARGRTYGGIRYLFAYRYSKYITCFAWNPLESSEVL